MDNETTQAQDYGTYAAPVDTSVTSTEAQAPVDQEVQPVDTYDTGPSAVSDDALMDPYADPSASWESAPRTCRAEKTGDRRKGIVWR